MAHIQGPFAQGFFWTFSNIHDPSAIDHPSMTPYHRITSPPAAPARPVDAHKGTFGTVIVIGGCATMIGAPALCASSALRLGAGLAKIAGPPSAQVLPWSLIIEPGATGLHLPESTEAHALRSTLNDIDPDVRAVLAVGPGLGRGDIITARVLSLLQQSRPVVLDADGLNALAHFGQPRTSLPLTQPPDQPPLIMTPHPGEFARLAAALNINPQPLKDDERIDAARCMAQAHQAVVVLKGHRTIATDGLQVYLNPTGNPALATGGSGDVLTGAIAGLLAQGMSTFDAAVLGVYLHGLAGDLWAEQLGPSGLTAVELLNYLPQAMGQHRKQK